ncbi:MAG: translation initiation factor IF-2 [Hyphomicrobiaceae bacterium]|nr:translation initiation factor IF-2 [Hyphomicrobiaceae bacterium]
MSETKETGDKTIRGSRTMTLNLKRTVDAGHVRQNFSHGRSKSVLVEKKKKRTITTARDKSDVEAPAEPEAQTPDTAPGKAKPSSESIRQLSAEEQSARERALSEAKTRDAEERERRAREEEERKKEEARRKEEEAKAPPVKEVKADVAAEAQAETLRKSEETGARRRTEAPEPPKQKKEEPRAKKGREDTRTQKRRGEPRRVRGKLTITNALDDEQRQRSLASLRRRQERQKKKVTSHPDSGQKIAREVTVPEAITIQELANRMAERAADVIKFLMSQGQMHKINDLIDADSAQLIAEEFGHTVKRVSEADVEEGFIGEQDDPETLKPRAPVVTVMGHVDHGKTSLLDALRESNVVAGEAGGITQHIGAYQVNTPRGQKVTFIDTPGHAAFTAMRARGAKVTDIVILVVAADDGVMPQTIEAINHAKAAEVPLIVAINKIDKPNADPTRVRTDLLQHEVIVESMSGDVLEIEVSAIEKTNLDKLIEAVLLQAELLELKANPDRAAEGVVIEAKLERGRGPVATVLVQRGTLSVGDIIVAGAAWGKVRALIGDTGKQQDSAGPSVPVEVLGFDGAPEAGDQFAVVGSEARAREITSYRDRKHRDVRAAGAGMRGSLEQMMSDLKEGSIKEFPLLVKTDVQGSAEAITAALKQIGNEEVQARLVHSGVGGITESDITLATASNAPVIGFNVRANAQAREAAEQAGIEIRYYAVIYDLIDDVRAVMSGMLDPTLRETFLGNAEVLEVFNVSKVGRVAGCRITEGKVERGASVRLVRDNVVIHEGKLSTLKRFKDEVNEVPAGQECGMGFENYQDLKQGDVIECFSVEEIQRTL